MNEKTRLMAVLSIAGFVFVGLSMINGCKKDEGGMESPVADTGHEGHDHGPGEHTHEHAETAMGTMETAKEIAEVEQKTCPVMVGNPIKKEHFVEYQGKKVYFCCPGCDKKFLAAPEKYLAALPQFKE